MAQIIDGLKISKEIRAGLAEEVSRLTYAPRLAVVLVGDNPASTIYVQRKAEACREVGLCSQVHAVPAGSPEKLHTVVTQLNGSQDVDGILVQLPLPPQYDRGQVFDLIDQAKDVDVMSPYNVGLLVQGRPKLLPCTPHGIALLLKHAGLPIDGKHFVVINRSDIVGKPLSSMLIQDNPEYGNATVTVCHDHTPPADLKWLCLKADCVVVAVGIPGFLTADMVQPWHVIIDVGITRVGKKIYGDVAEGVSDKVAYITPVPGGVGPMTVTGLLLNTLQAARMRRKDSCTR